MLLNLENLNQWKEEKTKLFHKPIMQKESLPLLVSF